MTDWGTTRTALTGNGGSQKAEHVTYQWTGPPDIIWIQRPPTPLIAFAVVLCMLIGAFIAAIAIDPRLGSRDTQELSKAERESVGLLVQSIWPMQMRIEVVPKSEIEKRGKNVLAFSQPTLNPCAIYIPDTWKIVFNSKSGTASWYEPSNGDILAHEMLHCYRGFWHAQ